MAPEHSATPGASRRVTVTYRGMPLADEPLLLEAAAGPRWFLHSTAPLPVGTAIACAAPGAPAQRLSGRVVEVVEPRRKARGNETTTPGMFLELDGDALAFPEAEVTPAPAAQAEPAAPVAAGSVEEQRAAEPAAPEIAPARTGDAAAEAAPTVDAPPAEVYEVEAAPPDANDGAFGDPVVLEAAPPALPESDEGGGEDGEEPAEDQSAATDDDGQKKKKRRRRKR